MNWFPDTNIHSDLASEEETPAKPKGGSTVLSKRRFQGLFKDEKTGTANGKYPENLKFPNSFLKNTYINKHSMITITDINIFSVRCSESV